MTTILGIYILRFALAMLAEQNIVLVPPVRVFFSLLVRAKTDEVRITNYELM